MKARMTVVETVVWSPEDGQPQHFEPSFSSWLTTDDDPFGPHRLKVGQEWQPLDCGWLKDNCGQLIIRNDEGRNLTVNPTADERKATSGKIIEVAAEHNSLLIVIALIRPGQSMRAEPMALEYWRLRCPSSQEPARATLFCLPR